jgi:two-component system response regulator PilR (NtrC family)
VAAEADGVRTLARGARVARVLVVDDEENLRELMELTLVGMGLDVDVAADLAQARRFVMEQKYALCLTDMRLPDGNGLELVSLITSRSPDTPVAVITAYGSAENAVAALKAGAFDYLAKPVALEALRALVRSALRLPVPAGADAERAAVKKAQASAGGGLLLGVSPAVEAVRSSIARMARSMAPVAISGESGSGKELAARLIHRMGARPEGPFIAVNCGAIPENLMESEFFGYRKGAFTGADTDRTGFFAAADGGTLFLDEVADLPLAMQVKLLRAIQEKRIRKVGSVAEEPVDARIISATHQDLAVCVAEGRFRQDLFYRLNVIELRMPPLRERLEDIEVLADSILERLAERAQLEPVPRLASVTLRFLQSYRFPGNVRELENILERALAFSDGKVINVENLGLRPIVTADNESERAAQEPDAPPGADGLRPDGSPAGDGELAGLRDEGAALDAGGVPRSLPDYLDRLEREAIRKALEKTGQNRTAAARLLGITFRALRYRMQRLEIN